MEYISSNDKVNLYRWGVYRSLFHYRNARIWHGDLDAGIQVCKTLSEELCRIS